MSGSARENLEPASDRLEAARKLYAVNPESARTEFVYLADMGSISSMIDLGCIFMDGLALDKSPEQAEYWYHRALNLGSVRASFYLGYLLWRQKKYDEMEKVLRMGIDLKYAPSIYLLGRFYAYGPRELRDLRKGLCLFECAVKLNQLFAVFDASRLLLRGITGFSGRVRGFFLLGRSILIGIKISFSDPTSPRLRPNRVW
jgi:TPR repeat protein